jgi:hypothetical protein
VVGRIFFADCDWRTLAQVYTIPLMKPIKMAETLPTVTGAAKKMRPLMARGSLFKAPTIEYVVEEVTRMHQAEQYEMRIAPRPEYIMPTKRALRVSGGKFRARFALDQSSATNEQTMSTGIVRKLL